MRVINRTAVTITGAQPFIDWMRDTDADFSIAPSRCRAPRPTAQRSPPEFDLEEDLQEWVEGQRRLAVRLSALSLDRGRGRLAGESRSQDLPRMVPHRHSQRRGRRSRAMTSKEKSSDAAALGFKYKAGVRRRSARSIASVSEACEGLRRRTIDLKVGEDVVRSPGSFDTGLAITFPDRAALDAYQTNAAHVPMAVRRQPVRADRGGRFRDLRPSVLRDSGHQTFDDRIRLLQA